MSYPARTFLTALPLAAALVLPARARPVHAAPPHLRPAIAPITLNEARCRNALTAFEDHLEIDLFLNEEPNTDAVIKACDIPGSLSPAAAARKIHMSPGNALVFMAVTNNSLVRPTLIGSNQPR